jgi:hypothetical protein
MNAERACIKRTAHGVTEFVDFRDFAESVVQDDQVAREMAEAMLANPERPYQQNVDEPEFYEVYEVVDADELRRQMEGGT